MGISLPEMARLFQADGYMTNLKTQWLPSSSLSPPQSAVWYDEEGVHERLEFAWESGTASLDTVTTCHEQTLGGVTPGGGTELDGIGDISWVWDGQAGTLVESVPGRADDRVLTLEVANSPADILDGEQSTRDLVSGYRLTAGGGLEAAVQFAGGGASCAPPQGVAPNDTERNGQYATRLFPFSFTSDVAASDLFGLAPMNTILMSAMASLLPACSGSRSWIGDRKSARGGFRERGGVPVAALLRRTEQRRAGYAASEPAQDGVSGRFRCDIRLR